MVNREPWVSDLKKKFSKSGCVASLLGKEYLNGSSIRQEYPETGLDWKSEGEIEKYMGKSFQ